MRKISRLLLILITLFIMAPTMVFAVPKGYKEVKLTKKNFTKYWGTKKMKKNDDYGNYARYEFLFYSKLLKKGYYLYEANSCTVEYSGKAKYKYKYKKKWHKGERVVKGKKSWNGSNKFDMVIDGAPSNFDYKYAKISKFKIKKAKGKVIFVKPSNVIGIEKSYNIETNELAAYIIKLKYPYDEKTLSYYRKDENTGEWVIDYYYIVKYIDKSIDEIKTY